MKFTSFQEILDTLKAACFPSGELNHGKIESRRDHPHTLLTISRIKDIVPCLDSSDSNDDVAVVLVSQNEFIPYIIYLSLVGDIAYIAALRPDTENAEVLKLLTDTLDSLDWQFALKDDLYRKSPFPTDIAGDSATIFNALFCDGYMMPNL